MRAVVERRLQRVPEPARPLLQLAAVAGRQLDLPMLRAAIPDAERWMGYSFMAYLMCILGQARAARFYLHQGAE